MCDLGCTESQTFRLHSQSKYLCFHAVPPFAISCVCSPSNLQAEGSSSNFRGGSILAPSTVAVQPLPGVPESQTQDETQFVMPRHPSEDLKRKSASSSTEVQSTKKKIKISIGPAVDLQD